MHRTSLRAWACILAVSVLGWTCVWQASAPAGRPFDGRSLAGWEGDPRFWRVEDGAIVGESTPQTPCGQSTWLVWTGAEVEDFELTLEVRLLGGNSGIQVRSQRREDFQVDGLQVDLDAAGEWTGGLYEQGGRGVLVRRGEHVEVAADGTRAAASLGDPAGLLAGLRPEGWNRYRIVARGTRVEVELNGVRTCSLVDSDPRFGRRTGVLALQLHAGPPMRVEFRNLRLLPLEPSDEAPAPVAAAATLPHWIWVGGQAGEGARAWFFRELRLDEAPLAARLEGSCDNGMRVLLNGRAVLSGDAWERPVLADVGEALRAGRNTLAVAARNEGGPAGLQLALTWTERDGRPRRLVTDGSWKAALEAPAGWDADGYRPTGLGAVDDLGPVGTGIWGTLPAAVPPPREGALPGEEVEVAEGYAVELLLSVPRELYGSWVALAFDARGRAVASHERGGLYRVTLPRGGQEVRVEALEETLGGAQGLLVVGSDLYVVAHARDGHPSGLYRLRDADGDDRYEAPELLRELEGSGEHGPHAVLRDPSHADRLLLVAGNHTELPTDLARSRVPRVWAEDQLLPRRDDPGGHALGVMAPGGWIVSVDLEGADPELLAAGMRNVYDVACGPDGALLAYDSDMEWDAGLVWYRPPRVLHLVDGADFGWRNGSGKWPADWPDTLPSVVDTDLSSPTGVLYGAALSAFAGRDRAALFVADWAYGRILAVDLQPRGTSWGGSVRPFVSGQPLPVTDLAAGPDGALYFLTGGRGAQSGLYRVRPTDEHGSSAAREAALASREGVGQRAAPSGLVAARQEHGPAAIATAWPELSSRDPFLRHAARLVLEGHPAEAWIEQALAETCPRAVAQAVVALAHAGDPALARAATELVLRQGIEQLEVREAVDLMRALELIELRLGGLPEPGRGALRARLEGMLPRGEPRLDRELVRLLVRLESERVVAPAVGLLELAPSSEEATAYAFALVEARAGWTDALRARFLDWVDAAATRYSGGASFRGYLEGLADDAYARLGAGRTAPALAPAAGAAPLEVRRFVRAWTLDELATEVAAVRAGRSFERGRSLFETAQCSSCHQVRGVGGRTGPDLTGTGARFRPVEVLESILEPARVISDQYQDTEVLTLDDELLVGRVAREDAGGLELVLLPPHEQRITVGNDEVARRRLHPLSRMPQGLLDVLQRDEILDLVAYVLAGGDPADPRFR